MNLLPKFKMQNFKTSTSECLHVHVEHYCSCRIIDKILDTTLKAKSMKEKNDKF